mmetsp:Transcript_11749/g.23565  ORF Transcript_11749/g.23565 Transcript_11749/m.23565 type:complete len:100 (+) Transcript_11749:132-431(+)
MYDPAHGIARFPLVSCPVLREHFFMMHDESPCVCYRISTREEEAQRGEFLSFQMCLSSTRPFLHQSEVWFLLVPVRSRAWHCYYSSANLDLFDQMERQN